MDSYNIDIIRVADLSKEFRFTNKNTIEFLRSPDVIGRKFFVRVKVASYVNKKLWRRKTFKSSIKYIKSKSSVRKVLTQANTEILSNFDFYGKYEILSHKIKLIFDETSSSAAITKSEKALKGYVETYNIAVLNDKDPRIQFKEFREPLKDLLSNKTQHKYIQTLVVTFKKESKSAAESTVFIYKTAHFNSKTKTILSAHSIGLDKANSDILNFIDI